MVRKVTAFMAALAWAIAHSTSLAAAVGSDPRFPSEGTPYVQARKLLLEQGFHPVRDPREFVAQKPDRHLPEINCGSKYPTCQALFLYRESDGWQHYAVVLVKRETLQVAAAHFAAPADGLRSIPDIPKLRGYYFSARKQLWAIGFKRLPMKWPSKTCANVKGACGHLVRMPEATCTSDTAICISFWRSPTGRILKVQTVGDALGGEIYYVSWSTLREQQIMQREHVGPE